MLFTFKLAFLKWAAKLRSIKVLTYLEIQIRPSNEHTRQNRDFFVARMANDQYKLFESHRLLTY